jgi:hypothetical protein
MYKILVIFIAIFSLQALLVEFILAQYNKVFKKKAVSVTQAYITQENNAVKNESYDHLNIKNRYSGSNKNCYLDGNKYCHFGGGNNECVSYPKVVNGNNFDTDTKIMERLNKLERIELMERLGRTIVAENGVYNVLVNEAPILPVKINEVQNNLSDTSIADLSEANYSEYLESMIKNKDI